MCNAICTDVDRIEEGSCDSRYARKLVLRAETLLLLFMHGIRISGSNNRRQAVEKKRVPSALMGILARRYLSHASSIEAHAYGVTLNCIERTSAANTVDFLHFVSVTHGCE